MEYKKINYEVRSEKGEYSYDIPEIGLAGQNTKPFTGGAITSAEQAEKVAKLHIDLIEKTRAANDLIKPIVDDVQAQEKIIYSEIEKA